MRAALTPEHVRQAVDVVSRLFPPTDAAECFALLAALNLLNAAVKLPWGRKMVVYGYVKGAAALLFEHLTLYPVRGVQIYHDRCEHVTYFRVQGIQISFHYTPVSRTTPLGKPVQRWDGMRLQLIAVELFTLACAALPDSRLPAHHGLPPGLTPTMRGNRLVEHVVTVNGNHRRHWARWHPRALFEQKLQSLDMALHFSIWRTDRFTLLRRKDMQLIRFIRYDGSNYDNLVGTLIDHRYPIPRRTPHELFPGYLYYITPRLRLRAVRQQDCIRLLSQSSNLYIGAGQFYNLLVTYDIACHLTRRFPTLRCACTLITNRHAVADRHFTHTMLLRIPPHSRMRRLKVWLLIDPAGLLRHFHIEDLPPALIGAYLSAEDYYQEFEITTRGGRKGIYAYCRHHLLPPLFRDIQIFRYHAYVQRQDGLWAIYSLHCERFVSPFIYNRIWYDRHLFIIFGEVAGRPTVIHEFFNPDSPDYF